jgi:hypothetical protein
MGGLIVWDTSMIVALSIQHTIKFDVPKKTSPSLVLPGQGDESEGGTQGTMVRTQY